jgi:hypothetical protein
MSLVRILLSPRKVTISSVHAPVNGQVNPQGNRNPKEGLETIWAL